MVEYNSMQRGNRTQRAAKGIADLTEDEMEYPLEESFDFENIPIDLDDSQIYVGSNRKNPRAYRAKIRKAIEDHQERINKEEYW